MKPAFPTPSWKLRIGQELVTIDAIARWYLLHLDQSVPSPYWMYKTASDQIGLLVKYKMVRFIPGKYRSADLRLLEITNVGKACLKALEAEDAKRKVVFTDRK